METFLRCRPPEASKERGLLFRIRFFSPGLGTNSPRGSIIPGPLLLHRVDAPWFLCERRPPQHRVLP